ncbi:MAG: hypothetical protein PHE89_05780, partial [Alphaproteobacteria bacterium]|nr:hypothetical protein [Alphaproteobacteria bacterium]
EQGGHKKNVDANETCDAITFDGQPCYTNCVTNTPKTCEDGGYLTTVPANKTCSSLTYENNTCYTSCQQITCSTAGLSSYVPENQVCSTISYSGLTCYGGCRYRTCDEEISSRGGIKITNGSSLTGNYTNKILFLIGNVTTSSVSKPVFSNTDLYDASMFYGCEREGVAKARFTLTSATFQGHTKFIVDTNVPNYYYDYSMSPHHLTFGQNVDINFQVQTKYSHTNAVNLTIFAKNSKGVENNQQKVNIHCVGDGSSNGGTCQVYIAPQSRSTPLSVRLTNERNSDFSYHCSEGCSTTYN